jgi:hypothetical protein
VSESLRHAALDALGPLGHGLAREALETGYLEVTPDVATWEASHGTVRGDRVVVRVPADLAARLLEAPAAQDELAHAISAALASSGSHALYDLAFDVGERAGFHGGGPYRDGA